MRSDLVHDFEAVDTDCTGVVLIYTPTGSPVVRRFRGHVAVEFDEAVTSNDEVAVDVAGNLFLYRAFRSVRISHTPDIQRLSLDNFQFDATGRSCDKSRLKQT